MSVCSRVNVLVRTDITTESPSLLWKEKWHWYEGMICGGRIHSWPKRGGALVEKGSTVDLPQGLDGFNKGTTRLEGW